METFEQFKSATTAKGFDASELLGICRTKKNMAIFFLVRHMPSNSEASNPFAVVADLNCSKVSIRSPFEDWNYKSHPCQTRI